MGEVCVIEDRGKLAEPKLGREQWFPMAGRRHESSAPPSSRTSSGGHVSPTSSDLQNAVFEPPLDPKYECPICMQCLHEPHQTACGHRYCFRCIHKWISSSPGRCPSCQAEVTSDKVFPDGFAKREIMTLTVKCPNVKEGCPDKIELRHVRDHLGSCSYSRVECTAGCGAQVAYAGLRDHLREECPHRPISCPSCQHQMQFTHFKKHTLLCPRSLVKCSSCSETMFREKLEQHMVTSCAGVKLPCLYAAFGCRFQATRDEHVKHHASAVAQHLELVAAAVQLPQPSTHDTLSSLGSLSESGIGVSDSPRSPSASRGALEEGRRGDSVPSGGVALSLGPPSYTAVTASPHAHGGVGGGRFLSDTRLHHPAARGMRDQQVATQDWVHQLEHAVQALRIENRDLRSRLEQQQVQLQDLQALSAHGTFVYKLTNYSRLKDEASKGNPVVISTAGFYTGPAGYKACLRINLDGFDSPNGPYLSLFLHMLRGSYDDIVSWPMQASLTFTLVDQCCHEGSGVRNDLVETFTTRPELEAFQRPRDVRNPKGFGYLEYATLETIETGGFLKQDTVIVKVVLRPGD